MLLIAGVFGCLRNLLLIAGVFLMFEESVIDCSCVFDVLRNLLLIAGVVFDV